MLVCWDQWYPEAARLTALLGAELLIYPTAIGWHPEEKTRCGARQHDAWETMQRSHAIANGCFVVAVNRTGFEPDPTGDGGIEFWGQSFVVGPGRRVLARAPRDAGAVLVGGARPRRIAAQRRAGRSSAIGASTPTRRSSAASSTIRMPDPCVWERPVGAALPAATTPMPIPDPTRPVVVASRNGFVSRNPDGICCVELAFRRISEGSDVLDALIAGVNIVELDPQETSVGYGGLPDADGTVTLDACCMHGPRRRAGGVAGLEGVRLASEVAKAVADLTDHHLLVGRGAQDFARRLGFTIEDDLNTEKSRALWLEWKRRTDAAHYPDPASRAAAGYQVGRQMAAEGKIDPDHLHGTVNCNGVNGAGDLCGVTVTSGLAWKIPGRVGDSPIVGAGLYVDNDVGAAGSTGRGEAVLYGVSSFLVVEEMRRSRHPKDAAMIALERIRAHTVEPRLLREDGRPDFNVSFYVLARDGRHAGVALYGGREYAVCDEAGPRLEPMEALIG